MTDSYNFYSCPRIITKNSDSDANFEASASASIKNRSINLKIVTIKFDIYHNSLEKGNNYPISAIQIAEHLQFAQRTMIIDCRPNALIKV